MTYRRWPLHAGTALAVLAGALLFSLGCGVGDGPGTGEPRDGGKPPALTPKEKKIAEARAKLAPEDRALVEAQDYCPVMPKQKLGGMGAPVKVVIKGQPVFLCCESCKGTAEDEPDETLKALAELKAKKK